MRAKFVFEDLKDIFKGRSKEEIQKIANNKKKLNDILIKAAEHGNHSIVEWALEQKNIKKESKDKALQAASYYGFIEIVRLLLEHDTNPNNSIAVSWIIYFGLTDILKLLLEAGLKVNRKMINQVKKSNHIPLEIYKLLLKYYNK